MKKSLLVVLLLFSMLYLIGCSSSSQTTQESSNKKKQCFTKEINFNDIKAQIYNSNSKKTNVTQTPLVGSIYILNFSLPSECGQYLDQNSVSFELELPKSVESFSGMSSASGNTPTLSKVKKNGKQYQVIFSNLISPNRPIKDDELSYLVESGLEFNLVTYSNNTKLDENKIVLPNY